MAVLANGHSGTVIRPEASRNNVGLHTLSVTKADAHHAAHFVNYTRALTAPPQIGLTLLGPVGGTRG